MVKYGMVIVANVYPVDLGDEGYNNPNENMKVLGDNNQKTNNVYKIEENVINTISQFNKLSTKLFYIIVSKIENLQTGLVLDSGNTIVSGSVHMEDRLMLNSIIRMSDNNDTNLLIDVLAMLLNHPALQSILHILVNIFRDDFIEMVEKITSLKEDDKSMYSVGKDENRTNYIYITEDNILHFGNFEYDIAKSDLIVNRGVFYDILRNYVRDGVIKFVSNKKGYEEKSGRLFIHFSDIEYISINADDKYIPKFLVNLIKTRFDKNSPYNIIKAIANIDDKKVIEDFNRWLLSLDPSLYNNKDAIDRAVKNGISGTLLGFIFKEHHNELAMFKTTHINIGKRLSNNK